MKNLKSGKNWQAAFLAVAPLLLMYSGGAFAQTADPMGAGMCYFVNMLTGKWVFGASVIGLVATGVAFISGVEMNEFVKKVASAVLVACFLLAAVNMVEAIAAALGVAAVAC